ncbi:hypothetical protein ACK334_09255, partial [Aeromonas veronii]
IDWIGHTEYSETRIEQLDHIFNLIGITRFELSMQANENKRPRKVGPGGIWLPEHYYIQDEMSNRMEYGYEQ